MCADDRLPTDPTPEESREQARAIREAGFVAKNGKVFPPRVEKLKCIPRAGIRVIRTGDFDAAVREATQ